jgi:hypothetical protein
MPKIHNWEEWDEVEDNTQNEIIRQKINKKIKHQNKKEQNEQLQQNKKQSSNRNNT